MGNLHEIFRRFRLYIFILLAFLAGCIFAGLFFAGQRPAAVGELDQRYAAEYAGATEIIGRLEEELARERDLNRKLREHNTRARELTEGLADSSERNVRNLQDAISLIAEIRTKLKVLADFYLHSDPGNSTH